MQKLLLVIALLLLAAIVYATLADGDKGRRKRSRTAPEQTTRNVLKGGRRVGEAAAGVFDKIGSSGD